MKIILSGPPGSGKGTQAEILSEQLNYAHFSTGNVFRDHIARKTPIGAQAQKYINQGELVPDDVVLELTKDFLVHNQKPGIIFDGFPRTIGQAQSLDKILKEWNDKINLVIFIKIPTSEIIKRLTARRTCLSCNTIFNLDFKPPRKTGVCDICGGKLYQRSDDTEPVIKQRIAVYEKETKELKDYYKKNQTVYEIDGLLGKDKVFQEIVKLIKDYKK
jgi:adenylate kinase